MSGQGWWVVRGPRQSRPLSRQVEPPAAGEADRGSCRLAWSRARLSLGALDSALQQHASLVHQVSVEARVAALVGVQPSHTCTLTRACGTLTHSVSALL